MREKAKVFEKSTVTTQSFLWWTNFFNCTVFIYFLKLHYIYFNFSLFLFIYFYCCSSTVISIFLLPLSPAPPTHTSHPQSYPPLTLSIGSLCYRTDRGWGRVDNILLWKGPPLSIWGPPSLLGLPCLPPEERCLSMPETGKKERNYLFRSYTDLE